MSTANSEKIEHRALRFKYGAATNGADFDRWHGNADLKTTIVAGCC